MEEKLRKAVDKYYSDVRKTFNMIPAGEIEYTNFWLDEDGVLRIKDYPEVDLVDPEDGTPTDFEEVSEQMGENGYYNVGFILGFPSRMWSRRIILDIKVYRYYEDLKNTHHLATPQCSEEGGRVFYVDDDGELRLKSHPKIDLRDAQGEPRSLSWLAFWIGRGGEDVVNNELGFTNWRQPAVDYFLSIVVKGILDGLRGDLEQMANTYFTPPRT